MSLEEAVQLEGVRSAEPLHRAKSDALTALAVMRAVVEHGDQLPVGWQPGVGGPSRATWRADPSTEKQISYALSLLERTGREDEYEFEDLEAMSKGEISELIDELKAETR